MYKRYPEPIPGIGESPAGGTDTLVSSISVLAKETGMWVVAGSMPEIDSSHHPPRLFNTSVVYDETGRIVGKYRKNHFLA
jgi:predicted amidohydrolase